MWGLLSTAQHSGRHRGGCHQWTNVCPEWSRPPFREWWMTIRVWTTDSLQVCLEFRLMIEFPSLPLPPICSCYCSKCRKQWGPLRSLGTLDNLQVKIQYSFTTTKYLRTVTSAQHWGITPLTLESGMRAHMLEEPTSIREVTAETSLIHHQPISQGLQAESGARSRPAGYKSLCPHLEPIRGLWLVKHVSLLL